MSTWEPLPPCKIEMAGVIVHATDVEFTTDGSARKVSRRYIPPPPIPTPNRPNRHERRSQRAKASKAR